MAGGGPLVRKGSGGCPIPSRFYDSALRIVPCQFVAFFKVRHNKKSVENRKPNFTRIYQITGRIFWFIAEF
jgi:hypothetical protein